MGMYGSFDSNRAISATRAAAAEEKDSSAQQEAVQRSWSGMCESLSEHDLVSGGSPSVQCGLVQVD